MTTPPATLPLHLDTQYGESVPRPEVNGREVLCGNKDRERMRHLQHAVSLNIVGVDDKAESLGSMPNTAPLDADVSLGHSIQLPVELWEKVIDYLADGCRGGNGSCKTYEARLQVLGRVCRGWHARCHFRVLERMDVWKMDKTEVYSLISSLKQDPERCHAITKTVLFHFQRESMSIFGTFAVCMAQKLPRVKCLVLLGCQWDTGQLHAQVFVHITLAFESVTVLELQAVRFPSAVVFGWLVRALPRLSSLKCWSVFFERHGYVAGRIWELHPLRLDGAEVRHSDDVVDFLVLIGTQLRHLVWRDLSSGKCQELLSVIAESLSSMHIDLADPLSFRQMFPSGYPHNLTPAVNLRVLSVSSDFEDLNGMAMILSRSRPSLPKLVEITIISIPHHTETYSSSIIQNKLDEVKTDSYALLDQAFSSLQYPVLQKVTFELHCVTRRSEVMEVISEESWESHVASRLPALHASGRLV
ncbi:uncharacterized protein FIBRA_02925 [Fibroporia radiculosa]|uniref:F-box domain-containing protein n=1 Tax=Fibroporia radiculosa TaxID=599839 RepID=J4H244_9APHY|nr:uncharacterized protein FIBRA_02925 [Fibroporia radiculosa]CCM00879.1 predicted protein [Fibroporia radiculosa]